MEGYSVTEAASVLGVPTERVWELLARGVLSGAAEGETGMRVFLQPRPAPPAVDEPRRSNGHGDRDAADVEASPFRELLTEFRNLTERYGQALLALGEARGEVASLRSRVDVLEARMDLRLPMSAPMPAASTWGAPPPAPREPAPTAPTPEAAPENFDEPQPSASHHDAPAPNAPAVELGAGAELEGAAEPSARRKRGRGHFSDEFADALARADDPSPAVLPNVVEAGAAFASIRYEVPTAVEAPAEPESAEALLPRELPAAEPMGDVELEPSPVAVAEPAITPEPEPELPPEPEPEVEAVQSLEDSPVAAEPVAAEPVAAEVEPHEEPTWDRGRYSADIEAPDWWTPESSLWVEPEAVSSEAAADEPASTDAPASADDPAIPAPDASAQPAEASESRPMVDLDPDVIPRDPFRGEETMLWFGSRPAQTEATGSPSEDAAGEMEVASTGRRTSANPDADAIMPGSDELRDALAALDASGGQGAPPPDRPATIPPTAGRPATVSRVEPHGPASRAYRRLRRIFPG